MNLAERIHGGYVRNRRARVLCDHLIGLIPHGARVLDVGCGDGLLAHDIAHRRPDLSLEGIDILMRSQTYIPVKKFDGMNIPLDPASTDVVMFIDVLHHTEDPTALLREGARVARQAIVIKDHLLSGAFAGATLRFMDRVGNARFDVNMPHNYWPKRKWLDVCRELELEIDVWLTGLRLYPRPADWIFGRSLHFIAGLHANHVDGPTAGGG